MKRFDILTLFPQAIGPYTETSILGRANARGHIAAHLWNIRDFAADTHHTVDDTPYGGGAGMVMKVEPIDKALAAIAKDIPRKKQHIIVTSAKGKQFTQARAQELAMEDKSITLICGRYEGIDQRVIDFLADEELSIGPYVLAGGELPALVIMEAVARHIPGVLGNPQSLAEESYGKELSLKSEKNTEYPQYTKPENYKGWSVPEVLLSGNHEEIRKWRRSH